MEKHRDMSGQAWRGPARPFPTSTLVKRKAPGLHSVGSVLEIRGVYWQLPVTIFRQETAIPTQTVAQTVAVEAAYKEPKKTTTKASYRLHRFSLNQLIECK
jgi:hypothetical protein